VIAQLVILIKVFFYVVHAIVHVSPVYHHLRNAHHVAPVTIELIILRAITLALVWQDSMMMVPLQYVSVYNILYFSLWS